MARAGALHRLTTRLVLLAAATVGTSACVLVPVPEPIVGAPAIVGPAPVIVVPRPHYHHRGGYYYGGYRRGGGYRWR